MKFLYFFLFLYSWIRIRIQQLKLMRIHTDPDSKPGSDLTVHCTVITVTSNESAFWSYFTKKGKNNLHHPHTTVFVKEKLHKLAHLCMR